MFGDHWICYNADTLADMHQSLSLAYSFVLSPRWLILNLISSLIFWGLLLLSSKPIHRVLDCSLQYGNVVSCRGILSNVENTHTQTQPKRNWKYFLKTNDRVPFYRRCVNAATQDRISNGCELSMSIDENARISKRHQNQNETRTTKNENKEEKTTLSLEVTKYTHIMCSQTLYSHACCVLTMPAHHSIHRKRVA